MGVELLFYQMMSECNRLHYRNNSTEWKNKKKEGKVYDYTGGKKTASVIYLTSGELVLTTVSLETLNQRMSREGKGNFSCPSI